MEIIYTLPESFASVIVNDDWSGLDDKQADIIESFLSNELKPGQYLTIVDYEQESNFTTYHDARNYGWLADNCIDFLLQE